MPQTVVPIHSKQELPAEMERATFLSQYHKIRHESELLCEPLESDDYQLQSILLTNPPKWHLAHVSWFFDVFLLEPYLEEYHPFNPTFRYLFNSYYEQVGGVLPRNKRGQLSRPTVAEIYSYRAWIDERIEALVNDTSDNLWLEIQPRLLMGLHHEQQHQELMLADIKHNFWINPLYPTYRSDLLTDSGKAVTQTWQSFDGGLCKIGHDESSFAYDNEQPRHKVYLAPFQLACRLVTNEDFLTFMDDDGYKRAELWLSDGWYAVKVSSGKIHFTGHERETSGRNSHLAACAL